MYPDARVGAKGCADIQRMKIKGGGLYALRQVVHCRREPIGLEAYSRGSDAVWFEPLLFSSSNCFISRSASAVLPCLR